jgi:hypothetical protein
MPLLSLMDCPSMAKTPEPGPTPPATSTTRIDTELLDFMKVICAHTKGRDGRPIRIGDYLDSIVRPTILRDHKAVMDRIRKEK